MPSGKYLRTTNRGWFKKGHIVYKEWIEASKKANLGRHHTEEAKKKIGEASINRGAIPPSGHGRFRDGVARYTAIHQWVVREKGRPTKCEHCGKDGLTRHKIQWANIDHKYRRFLSDYIRLCVKCHRKYDKEHQL